MSFTLHRLKPWTEVCGVDEEKIFAFGSVYDENVTNTNAPGGNYALPGSTVPAGEFWIVTFASMYNATHAVTNATIYKYVAAGNIDMRKVPTLAAGTSLEFSGQVCVMPGQYVAAFFGATVAGDDVTLIVHGYKMAIP